jgi:hypothetical protein
VVAGPALARAAPAGADPASLISQAQDELATGAYGNVIAILDQMRVHHADSPVLPEALLLAALAAVGRDDRLQERLLLEQASAAARRLADSAVLSPAAAGRYQVTAARRLGVSLEQTRDYDRALGHYEQAIELLVTRSRKPPRPGSAAARELSGLRLAAARLAHRHGAGLPGDGERYFDQVEPSELGAADLAAYRPLARDLMWRYFPPDRLGMDATNVSALATDGDDLWVGGWLGGLVRYAEPTGRLRVFREPPDSLAAHSVRDIVRIGGHIWVATNRGLSVYARASDHWHHEPPFGGGPEPNRVSAIAAAGKAVYVGTLGQGLWRRDARGWSTVGAGDLPGPFISALQIGGDSLWIGTLDLGLLQLDLATGTVRSFDEINPDLGRQNVTTIVPGPDASLWVGTFGAGLFRWEPNRSVVTHYSVATGDLPDDWVLDGAAGEAGIYFGTFGGGVVRYAPTASGAGEWLNIGLAQGLPSLDVSVVTAAGGQVYFGTLGAGVAVISERRGIHGLAPRESVGWRGLPGR